MSIKNRSAWLLILAFVVGLLVACGRDTPPPPTVGEIAAQPDTTILAGKTASLTIPVTGGGDLEYNWTVTKGSLSDPTKPSVLYTAPNMSGPDIVTVEISSGDSTTVKSITFDVVEPPTPTPTETPTPVPTDTPTPIPTPTDIPTDTPTPSATPCPAGLVCEVFPQASDGQAFSFPNPPGTLVDQFVEECARSGSLGLQLIYEFTEDGNGGWGVHWDNSTTGHFDATGFNAFTFWIKGSVGGEIFQNGLRDTNNTEEHVASKGKVIASASDWQLVTILFSEFEGVDISSIKNVNFGFNRDHGSGSICIDDIAFVP